MKRAEGGGVRLRLAKSNYAKPDEPKGGIALAAVEERGKLLAFEVASAPAPVNGSGALPAGAPAVGPTAAQRAAGVA